MRYNNVYLKENDISLIVDNNIKEEDIKCYKFKIGEELSLIEHTISNIGVFKHINISAINDDVYVIIKLDKDAEFIRVGKPPTCLFVNYNDNASIQYEQYNYSGNTINSGNLSHLGYGIHAVLVSHIERSFFKILNSITTLTLPERFISVAEFATGTIELQRGVWQLIAMPEEGKIKDIFMDRIALQEGVPASELFDVAAAYPGHINKFLSYIPGFTPENSEHNFDLIVMDGESRELTAFWVSCKNWTHKSGNIIFTWRNE